MGVSAFTTAKTVSPLGTDLDAGLAPGQPGGQTAVLSRRRLRALLRRPTFVMSAAIVIFWVLAALLWHVVGLDPYTSTGRPLAAPSWSEPFGTDNLAAACSPGPWPAPAAPC